MPCAKQVLGLQSGESNFGLKAGAPQDRTPKSKDDITHAATSTVRILRMFVTIEASKISIRVAVNLRS